MWKFDISHSFVSSKQRDSERNDFVDIPEQGHSWFYTSLRLFVSFVEKQKLACFDKLCFYHLVLFLFNNILQN